MKTRGKRKGEKREKGRTSKPSFGCLLCTLRCVALGRGLCFARVVVLIHIRRLYLVAPEDRGAVDAWWREGGRLRRVALKRWRWFFVSIFPEVLITRHKVLRESTGSK